MRFWLIAGLLGFCSVGASADIHGQFSLERQPDDLWHATFCFDQPVEKLGFERPIKDMRQEGWRALDPAQELHFTETNAQIERTDGAAFTCAAVEIKTDTRVPIKDYMAFSAFSDGGMSVYPGHMTGMVYKDGTWQDYEVTASYKGLPGERVITRDAGALAHQFVYFGKQEVLETPEAIMVIDPAFPEAARASVLATVPKANALLFDLFGYRPSTPYQVFMAAGELDATGGSHTKGGTQAQQIRFTIKGAGALKWAVGDPLYFPRFTLHEVMHIWQGEVWFGRLGEDQPWMHEGAADALADELMLRTGAYSPEKYASESEGAERRCIALLAETSVHGAIEAGKFDTVYQCGALVNRLVAEALAPDAPGEGLVTLWRTMAAWDETTIRATGSEELFFMTMAKLGFSETQIAALRIFLAEKPAEPAAAVVQLKAALGAS